jgi:hypothetical protein
MNANFDDPICAMRYRNPDAILIGQSEGPRLTHAFVAGLIRSVSLH